MNFFGSNVPTKKAIVRKVAVQVPVKKVAKPLVSSHASPAASPRPSPKPSSESRRRTHLEPPKKQASAKRVTKRKASTPPPQFSDDGSDAEDSDLSLGSARKRVRSSASSVDPTRTIADTLKKSEQDDGTFELAHGADLVSGTEAGKFLPFFYEEEATGVDLQYPSASQKERFYLVRPLASDGYKTMDDIRETVKFICMKYLPEEEASRCSNADSGFERRLTRAEHTGSLPEYTATIMDFNKLIKERQEDGTIAKVLSGRHSIELNWVERILDQIFARTVSPHVERLREYKNGTDNVYGELLYPLVSEIFRETALRSDQIFVDLGSGVGNVVLQAALEIGCESWGCEMMENPCELAELQADEFPARARMWGLSAGKVHLLKGDFLENQTIGEVLKRADVVLVNNQAFGPDLNSKLVDRFLDLKNGCRVVSLKSFKPEGYEIQDRNVGDPRHLLRVTKKEYYSNSVSWTNAHGNYFIATKDPTDLINFQNRMERRSRR